MTRYILEARGEFGGAVGDWRPAITGTLNQSGLSDADASTFDSLEEAEDAARVYLSSSPLDTRIIEIVGQDDPR